MFSDRNVEKHDGFDYFLTEMLSGLQRRDFRGAGAVGCVAVAGAVAGAGAGAVAVAVAGTGPMSVALAMNACCIVCIVFVHVQPLSISMMS